MNVLLDDDETMVRDAVRELLAAESTPGRVRAAERTEGFDRALWSRFVELGWLGVALPETYGGQGLPLSYAGLIFEELGRHLAPLPVLATLVPALVIARHGSEAQRRDLLPRIISGDLVLCFAVQEHDGHWTPSSVRLAGRVEGDRVVLQGEKHFVGDFGRAQQCLVLARIQDEAGEGVRALLVDTGTPGVCADGLVTLARDSQSVVRFDDAVAGVSAFVGEDARAVQDLMDLSAVFHACLMEGAARKAMEVSVDYVNGREAFGQPIGSFQAIQHMAADMLNAVDGAQLLHREALWRMGQGLPARVEVAQAKSFASQKCLMVVRHCQQMHGGSGFIEGTDVNLWYRRVAAWALRAGTTREHRQLIAAALIDGPAGEVRLGMELLAPASI